jgi:hypothetical protein
MKGVEMLIGMRVLRKSRSGQPDEASEFSVWICGAAFAWTRVPGDSLDWPVTTTSSFPDSPFVTTVRPLSS